jgi:hypothetical protein
VQHEATLNVVLPVCLSSEGTSPISHLPPLSHDGMHLIKRAFCVQRHSALLKKARVTHDCRYIVLLPLNRFHLSLATNQPTPSLATAPAHGHVPHAALTRIELASLVLVARLGCVVLVVRARVCLRVCGVCVCVCVCVCACAKFIF